MSNLTPSLLWEQTAALSNLAAIGKKIAAELASKPYFCLWLAGDIGAGKTTLSGHILRGLGLGAEIPVTSPTYTYINDYQISSKHYGHIDLYRAPSEFSPSELFHLDENSYSGLLIEWPEVVAREHLLVATHVLNIDFLAGESKRSYRFSTCKTVENKRSV
jgi:tRNA threonylcarbamoyl adenosine modification protein YjeE